MNTLHYIEQHGFKVRGRYISKRSERTRRYETCGILNEGSFYMFSENVYPFKFGLNFFDDSTLVDVANLKQYVRREVAKERTDFNISFEQYSEATKAENSFTQYYNTQLRKRLAKPFKNYYDLKGIDGFTAFPFIDFNNNFVTAQLIKYDDNGKRIKTGYSTTWLHSHQQAKSKLGLSVGDKYSVKIRCFFGEHYLKHSSKPVAIVEAPKTAALLKELHPGIDWIATAGESALFTKDFSVLDGKKFILFPDCDTTQWKQFAESNGYSFSDVLERNNCEPGSDLADYVLDSSHPAYNEIHAELFAISKGEYNYTYNRDLLKLNFNNSNDKIEYFTAVPKFYNGIQVQLYEDNSFSLKEAHGDKYFSIYDEKYNLINAQIDWHKQKVVKGGKLRGYNEKEFISKLHESYSVLKYLNRNIEVDVNSVFSILLDNLKADSNFTFNRKYVIERLLPVWETQEQNLMQFVKQRSWKYHGNIRLSRGEFITELNNSKFRRKLKRILKRFKRLLDAGGYIPREDLFQTNERTNTGYKKIEALRKEWNKKVIGCSTPKQAEIHSVLIECGKKLHTTYRSYIYSVQKTSTFTLLTLFKEQGYTVQMLADSIGCDRGTLSKILKFKTCQNTRIKIIEDVNNYLDDLTAIEPIRAENKDGKKRITDFKISDKDQAIKCLDIHLDNVFDVEEKPREIAKAG